MRFMARVSELGMTVTRPWGDSLHYDVVLESEGCWLRVQVKSTVSRKNNSYPCTLHGASAPYTKEDFEFIAAYIIPLDIWYIIPTEAAIRGKEKLYLTPGSPKTRYAPYREAWHLLREKRRAHPAADLCSHCGRQAHQHEDPTILRS